MFIILKAALQSLKMFQHQSNFQSGINLGTMEVIWLPSQERSGPQLPTQYLLRTASRTFAKRSIFHNKPPIQCINTIINLLKYSLHSHSIQRSSRDEAKPQARCRTSRISSLARALDDPTSHSKKRLEEKPIVAIRVQDPAKELSVR